MLLLRRAPFRVLRLASQFSQKMRGPEEFERLLAQIQEKRRLAQASVEASAQDEEDALRITYLRVRLPGPRGRGGGVSEEKTGL